jgi:hypothetical protein
MPEGISAPLRAMFTNLNTTVQTDGRGQTERCKHACTLDLPSCLAESNAPDGHTARVRQKPVRISQRKWFKIAVGLGPQSARQNQIILAWLIGQISNGYPQPEPGVVAEIGPRRIVFESDQCQRGIFQPGHVHLAPRFGAASVRAVSLEALRLPFEKDSDLRIVGSSPILTIQQCLES